MKHRHYGTYNSRTRRGRLISKRRPMHGHKDLNYDQLRKRYGIHPLADDDKDGKRNYEDCRPWDKRRQDIFLGDSDNPKQRAYFDYTQPDDIFIGNWPNIDVDDVADTISHEELHRILNKEIGMRASVGLDAITVPRIEDKEGNILNPNTKGEIVSTAEEAVNLAELEVGGRLDKAHDRMEEIKERQGMLIRRGYPDVEEKVE